MVRRAIKRPQDYLADHIRHVYDHPQQQNTYRYYLPGGVPTDADLTPAQKDRHGRQKLCKQMDFRPESDFLTLTCQPAGADPSKVGLLDFLLQNRTAYLWAYTVKSCPCKDCSGKVEAKDWVHRDVLHLGQVATLVCRRLSCNACKALCTSSSNQWAFLQPHSQDEELLRDLAFHAGKRTFGNIDRRVLKKLKKSEVARFPFFLLGDDHCDETEHDEQQETTRANKLSKGTLVTKEFQSLLEALVFQGYISDCSTGYLYTRYIQYSSLQRLGLIELLLIIINALFLDMLMGVINVEGCLNEISLLQPECLTAAIHAYTGSPLKRLPGL